MQFEQMTAHGATDMRVGPQQLFVSRDYNDRSNCRRALKAHAARENMPEDHFEIIAHPGGDFCFAQIEPKPAPKTPLEAQLRASLPPSHDQHYPLPADAADTSIPPFLDRVQGRSKEELNQERDRLAAKRKRDGEIKMPRDKQIKMPKSTAASRARAAALGMAPTALKSTGAKPAAKAEKPAAKKPRASRPSAPGERNRYDWKAAALAAADGKLPPKLDFSAETHARFRPMLSEIDKIARGTGAAGYVASMRIADLKKIKINPISSSPKALARYRDLCIQALKAQG